MPWSRWVLTTLIVATLALGALAAPAAAGEQKKQALDPCTLMAIEELETVFEQPFRNGLPESGGACLFRRPSDADIPDIQVTIVARRLSTEKKAKREFDEAAAVTEELSGEIAKVPDLGDEAFSTVLIGADLLTLRLNRIVADIRVDQIDDADARFPDQLLAVSTVVVTHLAAA